MTGQQCQILVVGERFPAKLLRVSDTGLLLLPWLHFSPLLPGETGIDCGVVTVELHKPDGQSVSVEGRIMETEIPFHVHCRVLVVQAEEADVPMGTSVWL